MFLSRSSTVVFLPRSSLLLFLSKSSLLLLFFFCRGRHCCCFFVEFRFATAVVVFVEVPFVVEAVILAVVVWNSFFCFRHLRSSFVVRDLVVEVIICLYAPVMVSKCLHSSTKSSKN